MSLSSTTSPPSPKKQPMTDNVPTYNLDRDPLSVQIRLMTGLTGSTITTTTKTGARSSSSTTTTAAAKTAETRATTQTKTKSVDDQVKDIDDVGLSSSSTSTVEVQLKDKNDDQVMQAMEEVASCAMEDADRIEEQRQRQELREEAIKQHSPAHEQQRQNNERIQRVHAEEDARFKHDLELQRQESERMQRWLAEESAQIQAEQDLMVEKAQEKEQQQQQQQKGEEHDEMDRRMQTLNGSIHATTVTATNAAATTGESSSTSSLVTPPPPQKSYRRLLVLYSSSTGSLQQRTEQDRSNTILTAHGLGLKSGSNDNDDDNNNKSVKWIDAVDPSQRTLRTKLFEISGLRGQYPQFFCETIQEGKVGAAAGNDDDDDKNSNELIQFLGDYDWIDNLNESGTLSKATLLGETTNGEKSSMMGITKLDDDNSTLPSMTTKSTTTSGTNNNWSAPPKVTEHNGKSFVVLLSTFGSNLQQKTNQERLQTILAANGIVALEIDASHPDNKGLRNELFGISGIRGNFPQVFIEDGDFNYKYVGGFDDIETLNDAGALMSVMDDAESQHDSDGSGDLASNNNAEADEKIEKDIANSTDGIVREVPLPADDDDDQLEGGSAHDNAFDRDIPPSLASATSSDGWFESSENDEPGYHGVETKQVAENTVQSQTDESSTPRSIQVQIVPDHAAGHGTDQEGEEKETTSILSNIFTPQVGLAALAVAVGIAIAVTRGR